MAHLSRRLFLRNSGLAVAGAGVVSQIPFLGSLVAAGEAEAPVATDAAVAGTDAGTVSMTEPLVAHIRDLSTGEIGIFNGAREVIVKDPQLAARLFHAAR
jgi:hypothetical protein